jgi:autotransporter-associated beta strand protein
VTNYLSVAGIGNTGNNSYLGKASTINIGGSAAGSTAMLKYTGAGEISDKVINMAGALGNAGIDQSGTGLLKFTNNLTATGSGNKSFVLSGSTSGAGEIGGAIVNGATGSTGLKKEGSGTWTLSGTNTYSGATEVLDGALVLSNTYALPSSNSVVFPTNGTGFGNITVGYAGAGFYLGNLLVQADATIDLGTDNTAEIRFGSATGWTAAKILTIANSTGGGKMYILSPAGVDLAQIRSLENPTWPASLDANGLLTFTAPTPSGTTLTTWLGVATATDELLLQYAFGAVSAPQPVAHAYLPQASVAGGNLILTYYVRQGAVGLIVVPELSTNLVGVNGGFTPSDPISPSITDVGYEISDVQGVFVQRRTAAVPIESGAARKFLRLRVTQN